MTRAILLRLAAGVGVVGAVFTLVFAVLRVLPGDPVSLAANADAAGGAPSQATIAALRAQYGLDRPLWQQYLTALGDFVRGDWGTSVVTGQPVTTTLLDALPSTAELALSALVIGAVTAFVLAFVATYRPDGIVARVVGQIPSTLVSLPTFAVGLVLIQVFAFGLHLLPAFGDDGAASLVLPAITLAVPVAGYLAQIMMSGMREAAAEPFVDVARAKGASDVAVHLRHVAPAAVIPTLSALGVLVGSALAGAVVVETVFSRAGLGRLTQQAVAAHDGPVMLATVVVSAAVFVVLTLAVDLVSPLIDPRARVTT
ncbi:putative ABC transporter permease protein [Gordonia effusa NBRC 100432]|uniref:Putative ABC transporter permease protein n=1 Tax=Gordonia effusa NBRC 100432 TaxID=1077974 RepID=H0QZ93_9ACTN|nr:ABC transporter permease [Gordonia effusa]GAB18144.1 putative ABC transporter permease protein [Gordonia effusa NBRC 100432]